MNLPELHNAPPLYCDAKLWFVIFNINSNGVLKIGE